MGQQKDLKRSKTVFDFAFSSTSTTYLTFLDLASVAACFFTISWLIYVVFVKDFIEIFVYTTIKYTNRFKWLYGVLQMDKLLNLDTLNSPESGMSIKSLKPVKVLDKACVYHQGSPSGATMNRYLMCSPATTPLSAASIPSVNPRKIDFNQDESTFQNVDLGSTETCTTTDAVFTTVEEGPQTSKENFFRDKLNKLKFLSQFRPQCDTLPSPHCVKIKCENLAAKVAAEVHADQAGDKEKLILSCESPERIGCCDVLFRCFKSKFQRNQVESCSMYYKRF